VLAFHTDGDLPSCHLTRDYKSLLTATRATGGLSEILRDVAFVPLDRRGIVAASRGRLEPCSGPGWLSVGDAALSLDPLAGQGLLNALFTGLAGALAAEKFLSGAPHAFKEYQQVVADVWSVYRSRWKECYAAEPRWPNSAFWNRRHKTPPD